MVELSEAFALAALGWGLSFALAMIPFMTVGLVMGVPIVLYAASLPDPDA